MAITKIKNINFGGLGSTGLISYRKTDIVAVLSQLEAVGLQQVQIVVNITINELPHPQDVTALIAIDDSDHQLREPGNFVALPCPPYCDKIDIEK